MKKNIQNMSCIMEHCEVHHQHLEKMENSSDIIKNRTFLQNWQWPKTWRKVSRKAAEGSTATLRNVLKRNIKELTLWDTTRKQSHPSSAKSPQKENQGKNFSFNKTADLPKNTVKHRVVSSFPEAASLQLALELFQDRENGWYLHILIGFTIQHVNEPRHNHKP